MLPVALLPMLLPPSWLVYLQMVDLVAGEDRPHSMLVSDGIFSFLFPLLLL